MVLEVGPPGRGQLLRADDRRDRRLPPLFCPSLLSHLASVPAPARGGRAECGPAGRPVVGGTSPLAPQALGHAARCAFSEAAWVLVRPRGLASHGRLERDRPKARA